MSKKSKELDFKSLADPSLWKDYETFIQSADQNLEDDIKKSIDKRKQLRKILLEDPQLQQRIRPRQEDQKKWMELLQSSENELFSANVAAVDGTISNFSMVSGTRCRIGVVSTSYKNNRIERVLYVSERELAEPSTSVIDHFNKLMKKHRISAMLLRALMLYKERQIALERSEKWKFVHGELLPYELRTGLGVYRALPESLELGRKLVEAKNVIAVVEDTERLNLLNAGTVLNRGEYIEALSLKEYMENSYLPTAHFSKEDEALFKDFVKDYCDDIRIGVYKAGFKPYVFEAHVDSFDKAASLIMKDAENQPMRGFPLLIDYADAICSSLLSGSDFQRQVMFKTVKESPDTFGFEMVARTTRRR